jgi:hypothetical protein
MKKFLVLITVLVVSTSLAYAVTIYVPGDYDTIQEAIDAAVDGDSVVIAPGDYEGFYVVGGADNLTILGAGAFTDNPTIVHESFLNPIGSAVWIEKVKSWEVAHFAVDQYNPASASGFELWYTQDIWVHHIDVIEVAHPGGHGIILDGTDKTIVEKCLVRGANYDVVTCWYGGNSDVTFRNLTISANDNGIINRDYVPDWDIRNNLVYGCGDTGIEIHYWLSTYDIQYNNSWGNSGLNYQGFSPDSTNISLDPLFVGGMGWEAYQLLPNSPCIDAGDPASPLDPDGTIADIGCFYFDQSIPQGEVTIDLEPVNPPIIIPVEGGSFEFTADITCDSTNYALFDAWTEVVLPNGFVMGPLLLRENIFTLAGQIISRELEMYVSMWAMPGIYEYWGYLGQYPDVILADDSFTFEKLEMDGIPPEGASAYAILSGWDETEKIELPTAKGVVVDHFEFASSPNPFNPATTLRFTLPASGHTTLTVYDLAGRAVATLLDRNLEIGAHVVPFDGSHLASGMYLAALESGNYRLVERLLLVK